MKIDDAVKQFLSEIGKKGGAATKLKNSCRKKGLQHIFKNGICTKCGANEMKFLTSSKNIKKAGGRPPGPASKLAKKLGISRQAAWQRLHKNARPA